jgi:hypothetical protein
VIKKPLGQGGHSLHWAAEPEKIIKKIIGSPLWSHTTPFKIQVLTMLWVKTQILSVKLKQDTGLTNRSLVKPSIIAQD